MGKKRQGVNWTPVNVASKLLAADLDGFFSLEEADGSTFNLNRAQEPEDFNPPDSLATKKTKKSKENAEVQPQQPSPSANKKTKTQQLIANNDTQTKKKTKQQTKIDSAPSILQSSSPSSSSTPPASSTQTKLTRKEKKTLNAAQQPTATSTTTQQQTPKKEGNKQQKPQKEQANKQQQQQQQQQPKTEQSKKQQEQQQQKPQEAAQPQASQASTTASVPAAPLSKKAQARLKKQAQNEKFRQRRKLKQERKRNGTMTVAAANKHLNKKQNKKDNEQQQPEAPEEQPAEPSNWAQFDLHPLVLKGLQALGFNQPTPIQQACLPAAIRDWRDIIAAAETGSGKTLAFGIPILHRILTLTDESVDLSNTLCALILSPTRELALQIQQHLKAVAQFSRIKCAAILGGVTKVKQQRVLSQRPQIVIATPGRLWELIQEGDAHLQKGFIDGLRFLVLDEADRMISSGHFPELTKILQYLQTAHTRSLDAPTHFEGEEQFQGPIPNFGEDDDEEGKEAEGDEGDEGDEQALSEVEEHPIQVGAKGKRNKAKPAAARSKPKKKAFGAEQEEDQFFAQLAQDEEDEGDENIDDVEAEKPGSHKAPKQPIFVDAEDSENEGDDEQEEEGEAEGNELEELKQSQKETSQQKRARERKEFNRAMRLQHQKFEAEPTRPANQPRRQTFLFSATLMLTSQGRIEHSKKNKQKLRTPTETMVGLLRQKIDFQADPLIVDLSPTAQVAAKVTETRIECSREDKDTYLYYFLLQHPGKTLIFVNAISCLRRLHSMFSCLGVHIYPLHAQMQQRQRLKNLDRFKAQENAVIVATDVAARGLDIPSVPYVVHYQIPRSSEIYVHRAGRTARAGREGMSLALVDAEDTQNFKRICKILNKEQALPEFEVDPLLLKGIRARVKQAKKVDELSSRLNKHKTNEDWLVTSAKEMDIDLESAGFGDVGDDASTEQQKKDGQTLAALRANLKALLAEPLVRADVARKFLTLNASIPTTADGRVDLKTLSRH